MPHIAIQLSFVALHTVIIYLVLILGLRTLGRRQLGELTSVDLVILILLGSAVETAMVAGDTSLPAGLVSAATLLICNRVLNVLAGRYARFRHLVAGDTLLLVNDGRPLDENLRRAGLTHQDLEAAIRERGHAGLEDVRYAVREADGSINVVSRDDSTAPLRSDSIVGGLPEILPAPTPAN